jgi:hypothetical protein
MSILPASPSSGSPAARLAPQDRKGIALDALRGVPVSRLALGHRVSRKFVYRQAGIARDALDAAFSAPSQDERPLFWLPVTKPWLRSLVVGLVLSCHSSFRGVGDLLRDHFGHPLCVGTVHNILREAAGRAEAANAREDLSGIRVAALDEIFQGGDPVLAAVDARSGYCGLLCQEERRDADTWGVRLLEAKERGFAPEATVADFGTGLRAGLRQALPGVPCRADVFHPLRDFQELSSYLDNRAFDAIAAHERLLRKQRRHQRRQGRKDRSTAIRAGEAGRACERAMALADDLRTLLGWWRRDVLAVAGDPHAARLGLHDWIVEELRAREPSCPHRIGPIRKLLSNNRDDLLSFAERLDADLAGLAERHGVEEALAREALAVSEMEDARPSKWRREKELWARLGSRYPALREDAGKLAKTVVRASSAVENLNSRLRGYFFLRKQLGQGYLGLLRFYLNHRKSGPGARSGDTSSAAERLSGQEHPHWLEMLGHQRFRKAG